MRRRLFDSDHDDFRALCRDLFRTKAAPYAAEWEAAGVVPRAVWSDAGKAGLLAFQAPERFGGMGIKDFRFNTILAEEAVHTGSVSVGVGFGMHNDIVAPYLLELGNEQQLERWIPRYVAGDLIGAIAMTEPGAGSDLKGIRTSAIADGDHYVVNGSKIFITNGILADLVVTAVKTDPAAGAAGVSLLVLERGMPGFERGRKLAKAGMKSQDTAELIFTDVRVPRANLLGAEGQGFAYLMSNLPQERISIAVNAVAIAERALSITLEYCKQREAFGQAIGSFQAVKFALAEIATKTRVGRSYLDDCIQALLAGELTPAEAAGAKQWTTDMQFEVVDACVQLYGGYGYMDEYEISRLWRDSRVSRIYGGTNEIMKEIVGRDLGLGR